MVRSLVEVDGSDVRKRLVALQMLSALLNSALPGGLEGPLFHDAEVVNSYSFRMRLVTDGNAEVLFSAFTSERVGPAQAAEVYRATVAKIAKTGLPEKSLERIRRRLSKSAERLSSRASMHARRAVSWAAYDLQPPTLNDEHGLRAAVTKSELDEIMRALAKPIRSATALFGPSLRGEN